MGLYIFSSPDMQVFKLKVNHHVDLTQPGGTSPHMSWLELMSWAGPPISSSLIMGLLFTKGQQTSDLLPLLT